MLRFSLLFLAQLVWIFRSSASPVVEKVTIPAPIVVEPSQTFDGIDGSFSSFNISVGSPPQDLKVFISTSVWQTLVVVDQGCAGAPPNCSSLRGGEFLLDKSSTWQNNTADLSSNIYSLLVDPQLGYDGRAELGFDVVSLAGASGPTTLKNQTVGGFAVTDSYLGLLGIDPRSSNFTGSPPIPSYLQNLRNQSLIPSLSWGYTAGSKYRNVFGSLALGGYDKSRFVDHDGSWPIDATNNLAVQLQSITYPVGSNTEGLLPTPITVSIDSSLPYIWLPREACVLFEIAFGLAWDDTSQLYLVNDTLHTALVQQNASLTFNLGGMTGGSSTNVNITLPYAALDLTANSPLPGISSATRYYPLKRAANSTQYLLGRTFFQEAFVVADYERRNFSVFPCQWTANAQPDIVSTFSPTYNITPEAAPGSSNGTSTPHKSAGKSSAGPIAGGVVAGIAGLAIVAALVYFFWWRPKRRRHYTTDGELPEKPHAASVDPHLNNAELGNTQSQYGMPELQGTVGGISEGVFEMPAREEVAKEMRATIDAQEMPTPETVSEATGGGFPWRRSIQSETQSPSPLSSPGLQDRFSPMSSPSPDRDLPSPIPSPSMIPSSVPSPLPSPPPVMQPQPQRVVRPVLNTVDSSISE